MTFMKLIVLKLRMAKKPYAASHIWNIAAYIWEQEEKKLEKRRQWGSHSSNARFVSAEFWFKN